MVVRHWAEVAKSYLIGSQPAETEEERYGGRNCDEEGEEGGRSILGVRVRGSGSTRLPWGFRGLLRLGLGRHLRLRQRGELGHVFGKMQGCDSTVKLIDLQDIFNKTR